MIAVALLLGHAAHDHIPWYRTAMFWIMAVTAVLVIGAAFPALRNSPADSPPQQRALAKRKKKRR